MSKADEGIAQWIADLDIENTFILAAALVMKLAAKQGKTYRDICEELEDYLVTSYKNPQQ